MLANQNQWRDQQLAQVLARRQQQGQFEAQQAQAMQIERARMEQAARENALARAFQTRRLTEYEIPSMQMRRDAPDNRTLIEARNFRIQAIADEAGETGDFDPNDPALQQAPPEFGKTIAEVALRRRMQLKPELDRRRQALKTFQTANRMDQVAAGIGGNPNPRVTTWWRSLFPDSWSPTVAGGINPEDQAADMKVKAEAMRRGLPPGLLEQFAGNQDLTTGRAATGGFPKWYLETLPEGNPLRGRKPAAATTGNATGAARSGGTNQFDSLDQALKLGHQSGDTILLWNPKRKKYQKFLID